MFIKLAIGRIIHRLPVDKLRSYFVMVLLILVGYQSVYLLGFLVVLLHPCLKSVLDLDDALGTDVRSVS
jgi:hypothetical protein